MNMVNSQEVVNPKCDKVNIYLRSKFEDGVFKLAFNNDTIINASLNEGYYFYEDYICINNDDRSIVYTMVKDGRKINNKLEIKSSQVNIFPITIYVQYNNKHETIKLVDNMKSYFSITDDENRLMIIQGDRSLFEVND